MRLLLAGFVVPILAVAETIVVEHRHVIETQVQSLQKRGDTCVGALQGPGFTVQTTTCPPDQQCCHGSFSSLVGCIPSNSVCCDYTFSVSWCPTTATCGNERFPYCQATEIPTYATSTTSSTSVSSSSPSQSSSSSSSQSKSLPTGSIIGIAVSVACSVLGLIFGVGFKIWKHKRKERQERT